MVLGPVVKTYTPLFEEVSRSEENNFVPYNRIYLGTFSEYAELNLRIGRTCGIKCKCILRISRINICAFAKYAE